MQLTIQRGDTVRIRQSDEKDTLYTVDAVLVMLGVPLYALTCDGVALTTMFAYEDLERVLRPDEFAAFRMLINDLEASLPEWEEVGNFAVTHEGKAVAAKFVLGLKKRIREYKDFLNMSIRKEQARVSSTTVGLEKRLT